MTCWYTAWSCFIGHELETDFVFSYNVCLEFHIQVSFILIALQLRKRKMCPVPRKITLKAVPSTFSIIWNPRLMETPGTHRGVCFKANAQTSTYTHSLSCEAHFFFPARRSGHTRPTPHPGCRGFSRPPGDSANEEKKNTPRAKRLTTIILPGQTRQLTHTHKHSSLRCVLMLFKWVLELCIFFKVTCMRGTMDSPLSSVIFVLNLHSIVGANQLTSVFYSQTK